MLGQWVIVLADVQGELAVFSLDKSGSERRLRVT